MPVKTLFMKDLKKIFRMFYSMALEAGIELTYKMFNARLFRDSLTIPTEIWAELEPSIKDKI